MSTLINMVGPTVPAPTPAMTSLWELGALLASKPLPKASPQERQAWEKRWSRLPWSAMPADHAMALVLSARDSQLIAQANLPWLHWSRDQQPDAHPTLKATGHPHMLSWPSKQPLNHLVDHHLSSWCGDINWTTRPDLSKEHGLEWGLETKQAWWEAVGSSIHAQTRIPHPHQSNKQAWCNVVLQACALRQDDWMSNVVLPELWSKHEQWTTSQHATESLECIARAMQTITKNGLREDRSRTSLAAVLTSIMPHVVSLKPDWQQRVSSLRTKPVKRVLDPHQPFSNPSFQNSSMSLAGAVVLAAIDKPSRANLQPCWSLMLNHAQPHWANLSIDQRCQDIQAMVLDMVPAHRVSVCAQMLWDNLLHDQPPVVLEHAVAALIERALTKGDEASPQDPVWLTEHMIMLWSMPWVVQHTQPTHAAAVLKGLHSFLEPTHPEKILPQGLALARLALVLDDQTNPSLDQVKRYVQAIAQCYRHHAPPPRPSQEQQVAFLQHLVITSAMVLSEQNDLPCAPPRKM